MDDDLQLEPFAAEAPDVHIHIDGGVAVLEGIVDAPELKRELARHVGELEGVQRVEDLIQLPAA